MPALYLLDTDTASYTIKRHPAGMERKVQSISSDHLAISAVTYGELLFGLQSLDAEHRLHFLVHSFARTIRVLCWDAGAARRYAEIRYRLKMAGQPTGEQDMMIAAHALSQNAVLVTNNVRHLQRVGPELKLENWTR